MESKETLKNRIRGWFPQEPRLRIQGPAPKTENPKTIINAIGSFSPVIILIGIVCWFAVLSDSWIQIAAFIVTILGAGAYFLFRKHIRIKRAIKNMLTIAMLCIIVFTAIETYIFWNVRLPIYLLASGPQNYVNDAEHAKRVSA